MYDGPVDVLPVEHDLYELTKNEPALPDPSQVDVQDDLELGESLRGFTSAIIHSTEEATAYLRGQHESGTDQWARKCLMLQRIARNAPAFAATALIAAHMTPAAYRVLKVPDFKRGMVCYSANPDSPGAGHVFEIIGRNVSGDILTWTNDARQEGHVDVVDLGFYHREWKHDIMFAATWMGGFEFPDFHQTAPKVVDRAHLGKHYKASIDELNTVIKNQQHQHHRHLVDHLTEQRDSMQDLLKHFS